MRQLSGISLVLFYSLCASAQSLSTSALSGTWENTSLGYTMRLILNTDGTGKFDEQSLSYSIHDQQLEIMIGDISTSYHVQLLAGELLLSGGDLEAPLTFHRPGAENRSINSVASRLVGLWSNGKEMIDFRPDGNSVYQNQTAPYRVSRDFIVLIRKSGTLRLSYELDRDKLKLLIDGQMSTYNRVPLAVSPSEVAKSTQVKEYPTEILGQWCSDPDGSRCITLRADGTYVWQSEIQSVIFVKGNDTGTWYVQEGRFYFLSAARGSGSFSFQKLNHPSRPDVPMIVLENESFASTSRRTPWR